MSAPAAAEPGSRARELGLRSDRCNRPRADGHACRRGAGRGTDHVGIGPCSMHEAADPNWRDALLVLAENLPVREAFLEAVAASPERPLRELIEPFGYRRRDVVALLERDDVFADEYAAARGYDPDSLRTAVHQRGMGGSDKLLQFEAQMRLPEGQALQRRWLEGHVRVEAIVASPDWAALRERLLAALEPFPEALEAVLAALAGVDSEPVPAAGELVAETDA